MKSSSYVAALQNLHALPVPHSKAKTVLLEYSKFLNSAGGLYRSPEWQSDVEDFIAAYNQSDVMPFEKAHMITHCADIFSVLDELKPDEDGRRVGLGWTSEQAIESSHHMFRIVWERYQKMPHSKNMYEAVLDFNYDRYLTSFSAGD